MRLSRSAASSSCPARTTRPSTAIEFACGCGGEHPGLVTHDELDWAPLGLQDGTPFVNLMTSRTGAARRRARRARGARGSRRGSGRGASSAGRRSVRGRCSRRRSGCSRRRGRRPRRPAVRCPACGTVSVNLVSREHVDVPFVNDREVGVVGHFFDDDLAAMIEAFRAELVVELIRRASARALATASTPARDIRATRASIPDVSPDGDASSAATAWRRSASRSLRDCRRRHSPERVRAARGEGRRPPGAPARLCARRASGRPARLVLAVDADEEKDQEPGDRADDEA